jgi:hypothetical protein
MDVQESGFLPAFFPTRIELLPGEHTLTVVPCGAWKDRVPKVNRTIKVEAGKRYQAVTTYLVVGPSKVYANGTATPTAVEVNIIEVK